MHHTAVINVVGLTPALLGPDTPNLNVLARNGSVRPLRTVTPAVTSTVQSTFLTGLPPSGHGVVGNGWYFRDLAQVWFWRQSNHLVSGEKVWESARRRDARVTCAKLFWWHNMYSSADLSVTPRPMYPADGRKIPAIYSHPAGLAERLENEYRSVPFFRLLGSPRRHRLQPMDRPGGAPHLGLAPADPDPHLPAAFGLQPATAGSRTS